MQLRQPDLLGGQVLADLFGTGRLGEVGRGHADGTDQVGVKIGEHVAL